MQIRNRGLRAKSLPVRSRGGPLTARPPQGLHPPLPSGARVATHFPVEEPERVRHDVADVRQAQQHQRYADDGVEYGDDLAVQRFRSDVTVT